MHTAGSWRSIWTYFVHSHTLSIALNSWKWSPNTTHSGVSHTLFSIKFVWRALTAYGGNRFLAYVSLADLLFSFADLLPCSDRVGLVRKVFDLARIYFRHFEERKWLQHPRRFTRLCPDFSSWPVGILSLLPIRILYKSQSTDRGQTCSVSCKLTSSSLPLDHSARPAY